MKTRAEILDGLRQLRADCQLEFDTIARWNARRSPDQAPLNADPYGELRRLVAAIDDILEHDPGHGPIAELRFERSH